MKVNFKNNYLLGLCVVVLVVICGLSINAPVRFEKAQARREMVVKQRLIKIRAAEEKYRVRHGAYAGDFKVLVASGLLADSLQYIPYSDGQRFELTATTTIGKSGRQIPLMECGANYASYLKGLDKGSVSNLEEAANEAGRYPGLKIGDISEPNGNRGNWE